MLLLSFRLDGDLYGLALAAVERIVRAVEVTPLPGAPSSVLGAINVQGQLVPVLSLRRRLQRPDREIQPADQFLIAIAQKRLVAIVIDQPEDVVECESSTHHRCGQHQRGTATVARGGPARRRSVADPRSSDVFFLGRRGRPGARHGGDSLMADHVPDAHWDGLSGFVARELGLHFPPERRADLERALRSAALELGFQDCATCIAQLLSKPVKPAVIRILASHLTIGETYFFRDKLLLQALADSVLPGLIRARRGGDQRIRIWSAGCASGEPPPKRRHRRRKMGSRNVYFVLIADGLRLF